MWEVPTAISLTSPRTLRRAVSSREEIISILGTNSFDSLTKKPMKTFSTFQESLVIVFNFLRNNVCRNYLEMEFDCYLELRRSFNYRVLVFGTMVNLVIQCRYFDINNAIHNQR